MPDKDKLQSFYEQVSSHVDIGGYDEFREAMRDNTRRGNFYNAVSRYVDIGTKDRFDSFVNGYFSSMPENATEQVTGDKSQGNVVSLDKSNTSFEDWYKTVPADRNGTEDYNLRRAYELAPQKELDDWVRATPEELAKGEKHLHSFYFNENGEGEFMKSKNHPTVDKELEEYRKNDEFRIQYGLDTSGEYYKYVKRDIDLDDMSVDNVNKNAARLSDVNRQIRDIQKSLMNVRSRGGLDASKDIIEKLNDLVYERDLLASFMSEYNSSDENLRNIDNADAVTAAMREKSGIARGDGMGRRRVSFLQGLVAAEQPGGYVERLYDTTDPETSRKIKTDAATDKTLYAVEQKLKRARDRHDNGEGGFMNQFGRGFSTTDWSALNQAETLNTAIEAYKIAEALSNGKKLTEEQENLLEALKLQASVDSSFLDTMWERIGANAAEQVKYTLEFILTGTVMGAAGISGDIAAKGAEWAGRQAAKMTTKNSIRNIISKGAYKAVDYAIQPTLQTLFNPAGLAEGALERMTGNVTFDGNGEFAGFKGGEDLLPALRNAFVSTYIENFSEKIGEDLFKPLIKGHSALRKSDTKFGRWYNATSQIIGQHIDNMGVKDLKNALTISKDLRLSTGIQGVPGEFLEEVVGGVMNAMFVGDNTFRKYDEEGNINPNYVFNSEQMAETFLSCAVMSVGMTSVSNMRNGVVTALDRRHAKAYLDAAGKALENRNIDREAIDYMFDVEGSTLTSAAAVIVDMASGMNDDDRQILGNYISAKINMAAMRNADMSSLEESFRQIEEEARASVNAQTKARDGSGGHVIQVNANVNGEKLEGVAVVSGRVITRIENDADGNEKMVLDKGKSDNVLYIRVPGESKPRPIFASDISDIVATTHVDEFIETQKNQLTGIVSDTFGAQYEDGLPLTQLIKECVVMSASEKKAGQIGIASNGLEKGREYHIVANSNGDIVKAKFIEDVTQSDGSVVHAFETGDGNISLDDDGLKEGFLRYRLRLAEDAGAQDEVAQTELEVLLNAREADQSTKPMSDDQKIDMAVESMTDRDGLGNFTADSDPRAVAVSVLKACGYDLDKAVSQLEKTIQGLAAQSQQAIVSEQSGEGASPSLADNVANANATEDSAVNGAALIAMYQSAIEEARLFMENYVGEPEIGETYAITNDSGTVYGRFEGYDADGNVRYRETDENGENDGRLVVLPKEEFQLQRRAVNAEHQEHVYVTEENVAETEEVTPGAVEEEEVKTETPVIPTETINANAEENKTEVPPAEPAAEEAQIPRDKDGNIDYDQITDPKTYAMGLAEEFGEDAVSVVDELIADENKNLKKAEGKSNAIERRRAQKKAQSNIDFYNQVKETLAPQNKAEKKTVDDGKKDEKSDNRQKAKDLSKTMNKELKEIDDAEDRQESIKFAEGEVDTDPTDAQKEAGNYKKGHVTIDGMNISIENPRGSVRSGKDANGKEWSVTMHDSYGYIRMTESVDGDHIDIFLSDHIDNWNGMVFVVDQVKTDGSFDEHKVMYGFDTEEEARAAYLANYSEGWQGLGEITGVTKEEFKKWIDSSHRKTKPFAEYKSVKTTEVQTAGVEEKEKPVTREEIEASDVADEIKIGALAYIDGDKSPINQIAFLTAQDYVRSRNMDSERGGEDGDTSQLGGKDTGAAEQNNGQGSREGGLMDTADNTEGVSTDTTGGEDSEGDVGSGDGERGVPGVGGEESVHGNDVGDNGSRPVGSGVHGSGGRNGESSGRRRGDSKTVPAGDAGREESATQRKERAKQEFDDALKELEDILDEDFTEPVKGKMLSIDPVSLYTYLGAKRAAKILPAMAKVAVRAVQLGYHKLTSFVKFMKDKLGSLLKARTPLTDEQIDDFINMMWDYPVSIDGKTRKVCEWAQVFSEQEMRERMRMSIEEKRKLQADAEKVETKVGDINNIRESLPFLLPEQQDDVAKAELQLFDESHADMAHGNGKGMMFTNGTGTGKTYTGLGIVKRFIKQGKGRILIVTASDTKIKDWINDAKNLGINVTQLADTKTRGTGVVVTQYANMRQNDALLEDEFDLIVYDESHKIMENQSGEITSAALAHHMLSNRDERQAVRRAVMTSEVGKQFEDAQKELEILQNITNMPTTSWSEEEIKKYGELGNSNSAVEHRRNELVELLRRQDEIIEEEIDKRIEDPEVLAKAKEAVQRTKVVFLSATPFNTPSNIDYTEGYIFSYDGHDKAMREIERRRLRDNFLMDKFPTSHKRNKAGIVMRLAEEQITDAQKASEEEIAFADNLMDELGSMSGRILDSEFDYSREFPKLDFKQADLFNAAINEIVGSDLEKYFDHLLRDYNMMTGYLEIIKAQMIAHRIKQFIDRGMKVTVYHRRKNSATDLLPPFEFAMNKAEFDPEVDINSVKLFKAKYKALFEWEQTLSYSFPQNSIIEAFATQEERDAFNKATNEWEAKNRETVDRLQNEMYDLAIKMSDPGSLDEVERHDTEKKMSDVRKQYDKLMKTYPKMQCAQVAVFNGSETEKNKFDAVASFNNDNSKVKVLVVQVQSGKEGISLHDSTGKYPRVQEGIFQPQSPIEFIQTEGRIFRVGNQSNAIFEYPMLGLDIELATFAARINGRSETTENLSLGSKGRGLRNSISRAALASRVIDASKTEGIGGKELDRRSTVEDNSYETAIKNYAEWRLEPKPDNVNDVEVPDPIGYMMSKWANIDNGETVLVPNAAKGSVARYTPARAKMTAIESRMSLFARLAAQVGGLGRDVKNDNFSDYNIRNKYDVVIINTRHGEYRNDSLLKETISNEVSDVRKALNHLENSGRLVALVRSKEVPNILTVAKNYTVVAEIRLPGFVLNGEPSSILVIDNTTSKDASKKMQGKTTVDLSETADEDTLFTQIHNTVVPDRIIDKKDKIARRMRALETRFVNTGLLAKRKSYTTDKMVPDIRTDVSFYVNFVRGFSFDGYGGYSINYNTLLSNNVSDITSLAQDWVKMQEYLNNDEMFDGYYGTKARRYGLNTDSMRDGLRLLALAIETATGKTPLQLRNIANGTVENQISGTMDVKKFREVFDSFNPDSAEAEALADKIFDAIGQIEGLKFKVDDNGSTFSNKPHAIAYYSPTMNAIVLNGKSYNSVRLSDSIKANCTLHEMIHSLTSWAIDTYSLHPERLNDAQRAAVTDILNVYDQIKDDIAFRNYMRQNSNIEDNAEYGLTNSHEMMAELSNPVFRAALKAKKLWRQLINGVKMLLGIKIPGVDASETDALTTLENALDKLIENFDINLYRRYIGTAMMNEVSDNENDKVRLSVRTESAPKKTKKVYKLMRLEKGGLYPLFIDKNSMPIHLGTWYNADSPNMDMLKSMPSGVFLVDYNNGTYTSLEDYANKRGIKLKDKQKYPAKEAIDEASENGLRWVYIEETAKGQKRYNGETRKYWNLGINGSGSVSTFAMRPGWHAGSLPTMRQIGKGAERNLRDAKFVWVEGEIAADVDYQNEAEGNPDNDIPTHIPENGFYLKATNADKAKSQADRVGWYVSGAFKAVRVIGDNEARRIIDEYNESHPDAPVEYDYEREGDVMFTDEDARRFNDTARESADIAFNAVLESLSKAGIEVVEATDEEVREMRKNSKPLRTSDGMLMGWVDADGKIHLSKEGMNAETAIHEYTHLWVDALRNNNPELWKKIKDMLVKDNPMYDEIKKSPAYSNINDNDDLIAEEILARISGKRNAIRIEDAARKVMDENPGIEGAVKSASLIERLRDALREFWTWCGKTMFGKDDSVTTEQVTEMILADLVNGVNPNGPKSGREKLISLSQRFNDENNDIRFSVGTHVIDNGKAPRLSVEGETAESGTQESNEAFVSDILNNMLGVRKDGSRKKSFKGRIIDQKRRWMDSLDPLKKLQQAIEKATGKPLADFEDAYNAELRRASVSMPMIERYTDSYLLPMIEAAGNVLKYAKANGLDIDENTLGLYLIAKHGLERNEYFKKLNEWDEVRDMAGLTALAKELGREDEDFTNVASDFVDEIEGKIPGDMIDGMWSKINDTTHAILGKYLESGLISKKQHDEYIKRYKNYVPLRGWDETTSDEFYNYSVLDPHFQSAIKQAKGRTSLANNVLANIMNMTESAIVIGEKNKVLQRLFNLAQGRKSDVLKTQRSWFVRNQQGEWEETLPQITEEMTQEQVANAIADFESNMERLSQLGEAKQSLNRADVGVKIKPFNVHEHYVPVFVNGRKHAVIINADPMIVKSLTDSNELKNTMFIGAMRNATRFMSQINTTFNPEFIVKNVLRDAGMAMISSYIEGGMAYANNVRKNINRFGMRYLGQLIRNGKCDDEEVTRYWKEFLDNGGETGFTRTLNVDEQAKRLKKLYKNMLAGKEIDQKGMFDTITSAIDSFNRWGEDLSRFAVFVTNRQMGRSVEKSVNMAKNATINFQRKGGGTIAAWFRTTRSFFNAGMQALYRFGSLAKNNPERFAVASVAMVVSGLLVPAINIMMLSLTGGDDDDWNAYRFMSEFTGNHSWHMFVGDGFITIPYPQEFAALFAAGNIVFRHAIGWADRDSTIAGDMFNMALEQLPFDVGAGGSMNWKLVNTFVPQVLQPFAEVYINEDFIGRPIYRKTPFNENDPDWTKAYKSTSGTLVEIAKRLNGNDPVMKHSKYFDWLNNPAAWQHVITSEAGGIGRIVSNISRMLENGYSSDNMPFLRNLYMTSDMSKYAPQVSRNYYALLEEFNTLNDNVNGYESNDETTYEFLNRYMRLKTSPEYMAMEETKEIMKEIKTEQDNLKLMQSYGASKELIDYRRDLITGKQMEVLDITNNIIIDNGRPVTKSFNEFINKLRKEK